MSIPITPIPMSSPDLTDAEREAVLAVLQTPNLSMGARIDAFEDAVRAFTGAKHAIGVNSGTAGLHLCVRAAGIQAGRYGHHHAFFVRGIDQCPALRKCRAGVCGCGSADRQHRPGAGGRSRFCDFLAVALPARRWLPRKGVATSGKLKALLPVDVFGQPADMDALREIADRYGLALIEDSCEALGAEYKGRKAGMLGDHGYFAFYPNKQITTGEGGMVVTNDDEAAA